MRTLPAIAGCNPTIFFFFWICGVTSPQLRSEVKLQNEITIGNSFLEGELWQADDKRRNKAGAAGHGL